jgi:hypothetical protein
MANLDYTNIAGSAFQPYVATQIEKRKALVNKDYRSSSELNWLSNRNVWIRISSGANVSPGNKRYQGLEGNELSKKYILQGGVLNHLGGADSYTLRSGVGPDGAYGIGGTDFGLVPMPGLIDISIKTGGKLGTLKETTFNFVCHNMEQLNIMEALYMKLGFGVLVEWGHTNYINNDTGTIETTPLPLPFYGIDTKEELMEKIAANRKNHSGNYDASWGTVKNFSYTLDGNGRFKCQVQLVGAGDILESLKVNLSGEFKSENPPNVASDNANTSSMYPVVSDKNLSLLNSALFNIYQNNVINQNNIAGSYIDFNDTYKGWLDYIFGVDNISISNWFKNPELIKKGYNFRLINTPGMDAPHTSNIDSIVPEIIPEKFFSRLVAGYEIDGAGLNNNDDTKPGLEQVYITLGHLLLLINKLGMIYERKKDVTSSTNQKPYNYIDVNPDTNRCYTFPGHCSLDPTICLMGSQQLPFGITSKYFDNIKNYFPFYGNNSKAPGIGDADLGGKFMYTLVNINWVTSLMKKWRTTNTKGDIYFVDLVKDILDGISKATGGYNEFRIVPDDDTQCIRILDGRRTVGPGQTVPTYTEIPILGKKSIVYNFDYTSKIAPNTAAMIVVAAQAQPYGVQGAENALAFSHLNKGLYNRLGTVRVDSANDSNQNASTNDNTVQRYVELRDFIEKIYDAVGTGARSSTAAESAEKEKELGLEQTADARLQSVPKENIKKLALERLLKIKEDLVDAARSLEDKGENNALLKAYEDAYKEISDADINTIARQISKYSTGEFHESRPNVELTDLAFNTYIHDKLEDYYEAVNGEFSKDTVIEAAWTAFAYKQTGRNKTWY